MHNIDRTQLEYPGELYETGYEQYEYPGEMYEASFGEFGAPGEFHENGYGEIGYEQYEYPGEAEFEGVFGEQEEIALAAELLEVYNEAEMEQFLGRLAKRAARAIGRVVPAPMRRQLFGMLRGVARKALPIAGGAFGNLVAPGVGGVFGGKLGASAGAMFGLELEGLTSEDQEFEIARRFVRLSGDAMRQAALQPITGSPVAAAQQAVIAAAQQHAPGLAAELGGAYEYQEAEFSGGRQPGYGPRSSGQWYRRGNRIVLVGA